MEPIISPWFVYALQVVDTLRDVFQVFYIFLFFPAVGALVGSFIMLIDADDYEKKLSKELRKFGIKFFIASIIFIFLYMFTPSRNTLIGMYVAQNVTSEAVSETLQSGRAIKDEIKRDILDILQQLDKDKQEELKHEAKRGD